MTAAPLKSLCQIRHGGTPSKANAAYWIGNIPWVSPKDMKSAMLSDAIDHISQEAVENSATSVVPEKSILVVVRSGILAHSLPVAQAAKPLAFNQDIKALTPDDTKVDPDYLFWFIRAQEPHVLKRGVKKGATVHSLQSGFIENLQVPLPAREEQYRIVDLLSRAEGIVRLRQEAKKKAAELIPALFLDMFGEPATNPKGWPVELLGKHVGIPSVVRTPDIATEADVLCMGADSIESMSGKLISMPTVRDVLPKSGKYSFDTGDVLYSKIRPYLAKATLAQVGGYCSADMYPLRCGATLQPIFLLTLLLGKAFTEYATAESVRASMPKLNREALFKYQFPLPPVRLQQIFAERAEAMQSIQTQQSAATALAQATFNALLARAFAR